MADGILKVGQITNSAGSGNITIGSGVTLQNNVPALFVSKNASQTTSDATATKVVFEVEDALTTSGTWSSANNRWTPGVAGTYNITVLIKGYPNGQAASEYLVQIYKNGLQICNTHLALTAAYFQASGYIGVPCTINDTASDTDYYEAYVTLIVQGTPI